MNTIHNTLREEDKTTPYVPSSPSNGILTVLEGGLSNPGNSLYGDSKLAFSTCLKNYGVRIWAVQRYGFYIFSSVLMIRQTYQFSITLVLMVYDHNFSRSGPNCCLFTKYSKPLKTGKWDDFLYLFYNQ